jgi:hypothetical protein
MTVLRLRLQRSPRLSSAQRVILGVPGRERAPVDELRVGQPSYGGQQAPTLGAQFLFAPDRR